MTTDVDGKRAFVMTLRAREQDIRREKAASNICTNQALLALAARIYLATIGPHGLRDVAALGAARAAELEAALAAVGVAARCIPGRTSTSSPSACRTPAPSIAGCSSAGVLAGLVLADAEPDDPSLADALLVCATEVTTSDEIARFAAPARSWRDARRRRAEHRRRDRAGGRGGPMSVVGAAPPADAVRAVAARAAAAARSRTRRRTRSTGIPAEHAARRRRPCRS